jgi:hypothetical protein
LGGFYTADYSIIFYKPAIAEKNSAQGIIVALIYLYAFSFLSRIRLYFHYRLGDISFILTLIQITSYFYGR